MVLGYVIPPPPKFIKHKSYLYALIKSEASNTRGIRDRGPFNEQRKFECLISPNIMEY